MKQYNYTFVCAHCGTSTSVNCECKVRDDAHPMNKRFPIGYNVALGTFLCNHCENEHRRNKTGK